MFRKSSSGKRTHIHKQLYLSLSSRFPHGLRLHDKFRYFQRGLPGLLKEERKHKTDESNLERSIQRLDRLLDGKKAEEVSKEERLQGRTKGPYDEPIGKARQSGLLVDSGMEPPIHKLFIQYLSNTSIIIFRRIQP